LFHFTLSTVCPTALFDNAAINILNIGHGQNTENKSVPSHQGSLKDVKWAVAPCLSLEAVAL
jgi:hypothetical protein